MAGEGASGVFGPPDPSYASYSPYAPHSPAAHNGPHTPYPGPGPGTPTHVPEPRDADGPPAAAPAPGLGPAPGAGKVSVSVAATSVPGADGRGRRLSCTVALAVAGALAAVTFGSVFVFDLMPGTGTDSDDGSDSGSVGRPPAASPAPSTGSSTSPSTGPTSGEDGTVPTSYLGIWEGDGFALDGKLPMGTFRVTVHQAEKGERLGTFRQTDLIGGTCDTDLFLKKVTAGQLVATSVAKPSTTSECTTGRHEVRLVPVGDDLRYETDNAEAGDPVARMSKAG